MASLLRFKAWALRCDRLTVEVQCSGTESQSFGVEFQNLGVEP
jgi:hypothetical protein